MTHQCAVATSRVIQSSHHVSHEKNLPIPSSKKRPADAARDMSELMTSPHAYCEIRSARRKRYDQPMIVRGECGDAAVGDETVRASCGGADDGGDGANIRWARFAGGHFLRNTPGRRG